jgi:hypothetical protein
MPGLWLPNGGGSRDFDGSTEYAADTGSGTVSSSVFILAARFALDTNINGTIIELSSGNTVYYRLIARGQFADLTFIARSGSQGVATSTTTMATDGSWQSAIAVQKAANDRYCVLNGDYANRGTNTTNKTVTPNQTHVGISRNLSFDFNGRLADVVVIEGETGGWNADQCMAWHHGASPYDLVTDPTNVLRWWPLWGLHSPEIDLSPNAQTLTLTGAPPRGANAPNVSYFFPPFEYHATSVQHQGEASVSMAMTTAADGKGTFNVGAAAPAMAFSFDFDNTLIPGAICGIKAAIVTLPVPPIGCWAQVPHQMVEAGQTLPVGVHAFHKDGITKVRFTVNGQGLTNDIRDVTTRTQHPDFETQWYKTDIVCNDFSTDGEITVDVELHGATGPIRDKNWTAGDGEEQGCWQFKMVVNPGGTIDVNRAYITAGGSDVTGTINDPDKPYATVAGAATDLEVTTEKGNHAEIIFNEAGNFGMGNVATSTNSTGWLTVKKADSLSLGDVVIDGGTQAANPATTLVHYQGLVVEGDHKIRPKFTPNGSNKLWVDRCKLDGLTFPGSTNNPIEWSTFNQKNRKFYTHVEIFRCQEGYTQSYRGFAGGLHVHQFTNDSMQGCQHVFDSVFEDNEQASPELHTDLCDIGSQAIGGIHHHNMLFYNIRAVNIFGTGYIFKQKLDYRTGIVNQHGVDGLAVIGCYYEKRHDTAGQAFINFWDSCDHFIFEQNTGNSGVALKASTDDAGAGDNAQRVNVSIRGNQWSKYQNTLYQHPYDQDPAGWDENNFWDTINDVAPTYRLPHALAANWLEWGPGNTASEKRASIFGTNSTEADPFLTQTGFPTTGSSLFDRITAPIVTRDPVGSTRDTAGGGAESGAYERNPNIDIVLAAELPVITGDVVVTSAQQQKMFYLQSMAVSVTANGGAVRTTSCTAAMAFDLAGVGAMRFGATSTSATAFDLVGVGTKLSTVTSTSATAFDLAGVGTMRFDATSTSATAFDLVGVGTKLSTVTSTSATAFDLAGVGALRFDATSTSATAFDLVGVGTKLSTVTSTSATAFDLVAIGTGIVEVTATGATAFDLVAIGTKLSTVTSTSATAFDLAGVGTMRFDATSTSATAFDLAGVGALRFDATSTSATAFDLAGVGTKLSTVTSTSATAFDLVGVSIQTFLVTATGATAFDLVGVGTKLSTVTSTSATAFDLAGIGAIVFLATSTSATAFDLAGVGTMRFDATSTTATAFDLVSVATKLSTVTSTSATAFDFAGVGAMRFGATSTSATAFDLAGVGTMRFDATVTSPTAFDLVGVATKLSTVTSTSATAFDLAGVGVMRFDATSSGATAFDLVGIGLLPATKNVTATAAVAFDSFGISVLWTTIADFTFTAADWTGTDFKFSAVMRAVSDTAYARLFDDTDDNRISLLQTASATQILVRDDDVVLVDGHDYLVQMGSDDGTKCKFQSAVVFQA